MPIETGDGRFMYGLFMYGLFVQVPGAMLAMMRGRMVLRKIIGIVLNAASPINKEVTLLDPVSYPIKTHVNGLGAPLLHGGVDDASCTRVVGLDRRGRLRVAHVGQDGA